MFRRLGCIVALLALGCAPADEGGTESAVGDAAAAADAAPPAARDAGGTEVDAASIEPVVPEPDAAPVEPEPDAAPVDPEPDPDAAPVVPDPDAAPVEPEPEPDAAPGEPEPDPDAAPVEPEPEAAAAPEEPEPDAAPVAPDPDAAPWPVPPSGSPAGATVVHQGRLLPSGATLDLTVGPAGVAQTTVVELDLTWRGDAAVELEAAPEAWFEGSPFTWLTPPPARLEPDRPETLRLGFDSGALEVGGHLRTTLRVPFVDAAFEHTLGLHAAVPPPLRVVLVGDSGYTLVSDTYGRDFQWEVLPEPTARSTRDITWGNGRFFRASRDGTEWGSPGLYHSSVDGLVWTPAAANRDFWASECAYGLDRFACARGDALSWSLTGETVVHEPTRYGSMFNAITFDGTAFVAVGRDGRRSISLDGTTIIDRPARADRVYLNAVASTPERIVAVGGNNGWVVSTSLDSGESWNDQVLCDTQYAGAATVAHKAGRWLVSGNAGCCENTCGGGFAWSDDGESFNLVPSNDPAAFVWVLGVAGDWYIGARGNRGVITLLRSRDGLEWTPTYQLPPGAGVVSMAVEGAPRPVPPEAVEPGPVVVDPPAAQGCAGRIAVEFDGVTLPEDETPSLGRAPAWSSGSTYAVTLRNDCDEVVFLLGDPSAWVRGDGWRLTGLPAVSLEPGESTDLTLTHAPGPSGPSPVSLTVPHTRGGPLERTLQVDVDAPLPIVLYGTGRRITVTYDAGETFEVDGWVNLEAHDDNLQRGGCDGPNGVLTVGGNALRNTWLSADGRDWVTSNDGNGFVGGCAANDEIYVLAGGSGVLSSSADGVRWTRGHTDFGTHLRDVAYGDGAFVAVGADRRTTTFDGVSWTFDTVHPGTSTDRITYGRTGAGVPTFVAIGGQGWVGTTTDAGETWLHQRIGNAGFGGRVVFTDGHFLAQTSGALYRSADGFDWSLVGASGIAPLAAAGRLVLGTTGNSVWRSTDGGLTWTEVRPTGNGPGFSGGVVVERRE
jgi:hypothetical protein